MIKAQIIDYNQNYSGEDDGQSMVTLDAEKQKYKQKISHKSYIARCHLGEVKNETTLASGLQHLSYRVVLSIFRALLILHNFF